MLYHRDHVLEVWHGDALSCLREMPDQSVQMVCTSPPYYGLRAYGTEGVIWDNNADCEHEWTNAPPRRYRTENDAPNSPLQQGSSGTLHALPFTDACHCGAWRGELGLEPSPELFIQHLVQIFREVRRVLTKDGTVWLNLGDSFWGGKGQSGTSDPSEQAERATSGVSINQSHHQIGGKGKMRPTDGNHSTIKPKDLIGIPWMAAFALRTDGWYLRSDIIWAKPNPMPESVTDRPTRSHEYLFLLSKSAKYYYDAAAIRERAITAADNKAHQSFGANGGKIAATPGKNRKESGKQWNPTMAGGGPERDGLSRAGNRKMLQDFGQFPHTAHVNREEGISDPDYVVRNKRDVWTVNTAPYPDAHFATYPPELITPCILAGSKEGDTVLDPFAGSFTTCKVAIELGRKAVGIELNPDYIQLGMKRCTTTIRLPFTQT